MFRRVIATALWAYFGWYLATHLLALMDAPSGLAVLGGIAMAVVASLDLRHLRREAVASNTTTVPTASAGR